MSRGGKLIHTVKKNKAAQGDKMRDSDKMVSKGHSEEETFEQKPEQSEEDTLKYLGKST
jgi:hypothetical protein